MERCICILAVILDTTDDIKDIVGFSFGCKDLTLIFSAHLFIIYKKKNKPYNLTGWWVSAGTLVSSTNKADFHDITEILLKVALSTITLKGAYWGHQ